MPSGTFYSLHFISLTFLPAEAEPRNTSLHLHAVHLSRPGAGLFPCRCVLEPEHIRDEGCVAEQQQFGKFKSHNLWEQWSQDKLCNGEPQSSCEETNHTSHHHLGPGMVLEVHATIADEQGSKPGATDDEETPEAFQE